MGHVVGICPAGRLVVWIRRAEGLEADSGIDAPAFFGAPLLWLRKGAEQGNSLSQDSLGFLYETGKGVPQDYVQAHMWYNLAASDTHDVDGTASQMRDLVAAKMTPAQIAEAQKMARGWVPKK